MMLYRIDNSLLLELFFIHETKYSNTGTAFKRLINQFRHLSIDINKSILIKLTL